MKTRSPTSIIYNRDGSFAFEIDVEFLQIVHEGFVRRRSHVLVNTDLTRIGKKWIASIQTVFSIRFIQTVLGWRGNDGRAFLHIARWAPRAMTVQTGMPRTGSAVHNRVVIRIYRQGAVRVYRAAPAGVSLVLAAVSSV